MGVMVGVGAEQDGGTTARGLLMRQSLRKGEIACGKLATKAGGSGHPGSVGEQEANDNGPGDFLPVAEGGGDRLELQVCRRGACRSPGRTGTGQSTSLVAGAAIFGRGDVTFEAFSPTFRIGNIAAMRFNLAALACERHSSSSYSVPVTVQIKPSRGMPGEHLYVTDSHALVSMLKRKTDLSGLVLDGFVSQLRSASSAKISGVELNDHTLKEIGYFLD